MLLFVVVINPYSLFKFIIFNYASYHWCHTSSLSHSNTGKYKQVMYCYCGEELCFVLRNCSIKTSFLHECTRVAPHCISCGGCLFLSWKYLPPRDEMWHLHAMRPDFCTIRDISTRCGFSTGREFSARHGFSTRHCEETHEIC